MTTYDLGDSVYLFTNLTDPSTGNPANATAALTLTKPDGTAGTFGTVNNPSTGAYNTSTNPVDQTGVWTYKWSFTGTLVGVDSGQFTVADPAPATYASLVDLKAHLGITDTSEDNLLLKALTAASRGVGEWCGKRRFSLDLTATARIYPPQGDYDLFVDDIGSMAGFLVEIGSGGVFTTLPANNYEVTPVNGLVRGEPITSLKDLNYSGIWWAGGVSPRVRVTARWGWPEIPDMISEATLLTAARLFRRKGSPEGVAGFNDMGVVRVVGSDPDINKLTQPFKRYGIA